MAGANRLSGAPLLRVLCPRVGFPCCRVSSAVDLLRNDRGSALLEFAISLPLLVVFVVGIYDFSGAFNQKQKIAQAAQEAAIIAGSQPTSDIQPGTTNPPSLLAVATAAANSLTGSRVATGTCGTPTPLAPPSGLIWSYQVAGCNSVYTSDVLYVTINRGVVTTSTTTGGTQAVCTLVKVQYPYHWQFYRVIGLLVPGATYSNYTLLGESATVHNQL